MRGNLGAPTNRVRSAHGPHGATLSVFFRRRRSPSRQADCSMWRRGLPSKSPPDPPDHQDDHAEHRKADHPANQGRAGRVPSGEASNAVEGESFVNQPARDRLHIAARPFPEFAPAMRFGENVRPSWLRQFGCVSRPRSLRTFSAAGMAAAGATVRWLASKSASKSAFDSARPLSAGSVRACRGGGARVGYGCGGFCGRSRLGSRRRGARHHALIGTLIHSPCHEPSHGPVDAPPGRSGHGPATAGRAPSRGAPPNVNYMCPKPGDRSWPKRPQSAPLLSDFRGPQ